MTVPRVRPTEKQPAAAEEWIYLEPRPESWRRQLYVRGRRLPAAVVWSTMLTERETPEQAAENWDLPLEAVLECIRYSESHRELLDSEAAEERRRLVEDGFAIEPPPAH